MKIVTSPAEPWRCLRRSRCANRLADHLRQCCHLPHAAASLERGTSLPGRWRDLYLTAPSSARVVILLTRAVVESGRAITYLVVLPESVENHQNRRKRRQAAVVTVAVMPRRLQAVPFLPADRHQYKKKEACLRGGRACRQTILT
uniref:Uncharacterized protein n=1 Tax=Oryza barthii TaxID=65489 RepID=A0A0D3HPV9_9ORYZ|nr:hypothetical protein [Oryza barthii]BBF89257.1 hypothetical protein [Oryza barthii]